ncbi:hypothetical protein ACFWZS_08880 [[Kitasatospora] papulosa]|uniref:hypothetical protein n=1 Tax=[Kitasatospora] papulosa TaxID=1464011 RepID=UPI00369B8A97
MKIRIVAAGAALAVSLLAATIPASADEASGPAPGPTPTVSGTPDDLGWGRASATTPTATPASTNQAAGDLGWG